jgi:hypothetical protein
LGTVGYSAVAPPVGGTAPFVAAVEPPAAPEGEPHAGQLHRRGSKSSK